MPSTLAQTIAAQIWLAYASGVVDAAARQAPPRSATYVDYDADTGRHTVQTSDGKRYSGTMLTNSGAATGDRMAIAISQPDSWLKSKPR